MARALEEKHRLVSEYYQIPFLEAQTQPQEAENTTTSELDEAAAATRDAREVLLAALVQGEYDSMLTLEFSKSAKKVHTCRG